MLVPALLLATAASSAPAAAAPERPQAVAVTAGAAAQAAEAPAVSEAKKAGQKDKKKSAKPPDYHEEIVVTATRYEVDSFNTPVPISVISAEDLARRRPEKIIDALKQIAGIEVFGEGPFRGLPVIRGMSSNRVLILIDGQRLNNARESTEFAGIQPGLVDLSQVDRIEVVRGPASVLYGSDAVGGVINIITKQPDFSSDGLKWNGGVGFEYGSAADARRARAEVGGAGAGYTFRLSGSRFQASSYESPKGEVPNSGMKQNDLSGNLRFLLSEHSTLRFDLQAVRTRDVGFPGYDPRTSGVDISFPKLDRDKVSATYDLSDWAGLASLTLSGFYQGVVKESKRNLDFGPYFFSHNFTRSDISSYGLNAQGQADVASHRLTFGLDSYQDDLHDSTIADSIFGKSTDVAVPDSKQRGLGLYVQDELTVSPRLQLAAGLRGDRYSFVSDRDPRYKGLPFDLAKSSLSGNVSARYQVTNNVALTGLIGRGFRAPNIQERSFFGLATTGDTLIEQNPNLDAETSLNFETGFKVRYQRYSGGFNVYYNKVKDLIALRFTGTDPDSGLALAHFDNIEKATISGAELELEAYLSPSWLAFGNVSYSRGNDDNTHQPLDFIAPLKGVVGLRYLAPKWWSEASVRALDRRDRVPVLPEPGTQSPGFAVYDLRGGLDIARGLGVQAAVENLTDKAYHEPFNLRLEPGRNYKLSLSYNF